MRNQVRHSVNSKVPAQEQGFSLLEMLVAMAMFAIVAGAALRVFQKHVPLFTQQQGQTAVNIALRNAAAELQMDLANAGVGYYQGTSTAALPVGVAVVPGAGNCYNPATQTYGPGCFDTISIISIDPNTPPALVTDPGNPAKTGQQCTNSQQVPNSSTLFITPTGTTTVAQQATYYKPGDEILVVSSDGSQMATAILTQAGQVAGNNGVKLQHNPSAFNVNSVNNASYQDDYYNLGATISNNNGDNGQLSSSNKLGTNFCSTAWVFKISAITYGVSTANPSDPLLVRSVNNAPPQAVADQIIGFKVGVWALDNNSATAQSPDWFYSTTNYDLNTVQGVRLSVAGRTNPVKGRAAGFRNNLDNGPYKIEAVSVVVDPRNLSMNK